MENEAEHLADNEDILQTAIAGMEKGWEEAAASSPEEPEPEPEPEESPPDPEASDPEPAEEESVPAAKADPAFQRMAAKEKEVRAQIEELKSARKELEDIRADVAAFKEAQARFQADPVAYLRKLDPQLKLGDLAQIAWAEELGDDAPDEVKQNLQGIRQKSEIALLREEMQRIRQEMTERESHAARQAEVSAYESATKRMLADNTSDLPLLARLAQKDESEALSMIMKASGSLAEVARQQEWTAEEIEENLNPKAVAKLIEKDLARLSGLLSDGESTPAAPPAKAASKTLTQKHTQSGRKAASPDDDLDEEALIQRATEMADFVRYKQDI